SGQFGRFAAEQIQPVLFMPALRVGETLQDLPLLPRLTRSELLIDEALSTLLYEVTRPTTTVCCGRLCGCRRGHESSIVREHPIRARFQRYPERGRTKARKPGLTGFRAS